MEEKALRKEKLIEQASGSTDKYKYEYGDSEVNDMLIDAIKGKLAMLDEMK